MVFNNHISFGSEISSHLMSWWTKAETLVYSYFPQVAYYGALQIQTFCDFNTLHFIRVCNSSNFYSQPKSKWTESQRWCLHFSLHSSFLKNTLILCDLSIVILGCSENLKLYKKKEKYIQNLNKYVIKILNKIHTNSYNVSLFFSSLFYVFKFRIHSYLNNCYFNNLIQKSLHRRFLVSRISDVSMSPNGSNYLGLFFQEFTQSSFPFSSSERLVNACKFFLPPD